LTPANIFFASHKQLSSKLKARLPAAKVRKHKHK